MLTRFVIFVQRIENNPKVLFISQEVCIGCVNKKRLDVVLTDIIGVGFLDIEKILVFYGLFIGAVSFPDILLQFTYRRMQINDNVGLN